jgi:hypothetical protein
LNTTRRRRIQLPRRTFVLPSWQLDFLAVKGPPITVKCECGALEHVPYGDVWTCGQCGRRWNTNQIAAEEYDAILREMKRFRLSAIGAAIVIAAVFGILALVVSSGLFLLLPVVLGGWYIWYMPLWRRRVRRRARSLPKWNLTPE